MAKLSAGQKRRQKELKRKKKKQLQVKKHQSLIAYAAPPSVLPKLSERLIEFAGDLLDNPNANQQFMNSAIGFAVMCWNIGVVNAEKARELLATSLQVLGEDMGSLPEEIEEQMDFLITKKRFLYGDDPRLIAEYSVNWGLGSQYHIQVKSLVLQDDERFVPSLENSAMGMSDKTRTRLSVLQTPLTEQEKIIEQQIEEGFSLLRQTATPDGKDSSVAACELWLGTWEIIKTLYQDISAFQDINNKLSPILDFWSSDMDMHLQNASLAEPAFTEKGITFLREFLEHFPDSHKGFHTLYRRAIAELLFQMGEHDEGEATFVALTREYPEYTWGYIAWGNIYNPTHSRKLYGNTAADIERAKRLYRIPIVRELEDKEDARERLEELLDYEREASTMLDG